MSANLSTTLVELFSLKDQDRRERTRIRVEFFGISVAIISLLFVGCQIKQQHDKIEIQTILEIEDSERFINQLALSKPELSLLLENAESVLEAHAMITECSFRSDDIKNAENLNRMDVDGLATLQFIRNVNKKCAQENLSGDYMAFFVGEAEKLLHLLPVSQIADYYEIAEKENEQTSLARFQALRALVEQLRARVNTAGYIMLQEFEKMFRVCQKKILDEIYWRGENAFEKRMQNELKGEPLKSMFEDKSLISGFHPEFVVYADRLVEVNLDHDSKERDVFERTYCSFKPTGWWGRGVI